MAKTKAHNEYFRVVSLGNRKSCPCCHEKLPFGENIWSWGEYVRAKWNTVAYFCASCWNRDSSSPKQRLLDHVGPCDCVVNLVGYRGDKLPTWLTLEQEVSHA